MSRETVVITVASCPAETDDAILCIMSDNEDGSTVRQVWVPRSQMAERDQRNNAYKGEEDFDLEVFKWFADREGLG